MNGSQEIKAYIQERPKNTQKAPRHALQILFSRVTVDCGVNMAQLLNNVKMYQEQEMINIWQNIEPTDKGNQKKTTNHKAISKMERYEYTNETTHKRGSISYTNTRV